MSTRKLPPKTYVFIDVANIIYGAKKTGKWKVSYLKLINYLKTRYDAHRIFFFAGVKSIEKNNFNKLANYGYVLRLKELKIYKRKPSIRKIKCPNCKRDFVKKFYRHPELKANCDVDLTFEAMRHSSDYSRMILLSGDGDFYPLVKFLLEKGRELRVIAESRSTSITIKNLIGQNFIDLQSIKHIIKK